MDAAALAKGPVSSSRRTSFSGTVLTNVSWCCSTTGLLPGAMPAAFAGTPAAPTDADTRQQVSQGKAASGIGTGAAAPTKD